MPALHAHPDAMATLASTTAAFWQPAAPLPEQSDWLGALCEALPGAVCCVDEALIVQYWNQAMARLVGVTHRQALHKPVFSLVPSGFEQSLRGELQRLFESAHREQGENAKLPLHLQGEFQQQHGNGPGFTFRYHLSMLPWTGGQRLAMLALSEIPQGRLRHRQNQLLERLLLLGRLNTSVAHELAGALDVICHRLDDLLALATPGGNRELEAGLHDIITQVYRISYLTNNMVSLARDASAHLVALDLNDAILEALALLQQTMGHEVLCTMVLAPNLPPVTGDAILLQVALQNLLKYAILAAGEDAVPKVQTEPLPHGGGVVMRLEDRGTTRDAETLERFFDPVFSAEKFGLGVGLGLFLSRRIIEAHDGEIRVRPHEAHGTEIVISFPSVRG
ncbi:MAG: PAS domain-containing sensor histidine kinase [candidate division KSB1 bacterium]|nr:PAS domain-containing sensor histidine kinase [candidate division KSB1 bacterium]MDZ7275148.1 PAS domain-containing sensor histidine kinase [candidate division KSB1 bacterium]MDZ7287317.1 PAS domain-containing sensor histidine kinase [candidate division KSB1 bacterium]MDZ7299431.1 PAS domain-containing sensor histidine kinase [candidate division KSB1 bacterium]MDZ7308740.1 PAS domain-containing sensor histidine kinase [candidate division KSB1 bacterium]